RPWYSLGVLQHERGRPAEAVISYGEALHSCPDSPRLQYHLALAQVAAGASDAHFGDGDRRSVAAALDDLGRTAPVWQEGADRLIALVAAAAGVDGPTSKGRAPVDGFVRALASLLRLDQAARVHAQSGPLGWEAAADADRALISSA